MTPWGKLAGGVAGLFSGRWYGVLAGVVVGHQFDRGFGEGHRPAQARLTDESLVLLFRALGAVSKADGPITEAEIRAARKLMSSLGLTPEQTVRAQSDFNVGKHADYELFREATDHFDGFRSRIPERTLMLQLLLGGALDSGALGKRTRGALWEFAQALNFTRVEFAQLEAIMRSQRGFSRSEQGVEAQNNLEAAYALLGVPASASNREIKKAYRQLMSRYHPDKLAGSGQGGDAIAAANKKSQALNQAYKLLQKRRGFR